MRLTLIVRARMARLRRDRRCSRVTVSPPGSRAERQRSVRRPLDDAGQLFNLRFVLGVHARLLPAHRRQTAFRRARAASPAFDHSIRSPRGACLRVPAPASTSSSSPEARAIRRLDRLHLKSVEDRGQSIVSLFFGRFHYGTRFACLDRCPDTKCQHDGSRLPPLHRLATGRGCVYLRGREAVRATDDAGASRSPAARHARRRCTRGAHPLRRGRERAAAGARPRLPGQPPGVGRRAAPTGRALPRHRAGSARLRREREALPSRYRYGFDGFSESLVDLLAALGLGRVSVCGHAMGGAVALTMAAAHAHVVEKLVLVNPLVYPPRTDALSRLAGVPLLGPFVFKQLYGRALFRTRFAGTRGGPARAAVRALRRPCGARGRLCDHVLHARHAPAHGERSPGDGAHPGGVGPDQPRLAGGARTATGAGAAAAPASRCSTADRRRPKKSPPRSPAP